MTTRENVLNLIDPISNPELYQEFIDFDKDMKKTIIELHKIIADKNDTIHDLQEELMEYDNVRLPI